MPDEANRLATPHVAAGVLFRDEAGRVLVVKPTYKDGWDVPGGYVEIGESPRAAAIREVREELGVDWQVGELLLVDWAPHPNEGDKLLFLFRGHVSPEQVRESLKLHPGEIAAARFAEDRELPQLMPERLSRRLAQALRSSASAQYLEHAVSPTLDH
ncbi:NUDIX hydrolase [Jatrophihabitans telluris]|uniref:NUDIX hydrolase n=1 Tax=Jatrophihabitans telluris TaxID=2038343 RepID=A0ABY4QVL0_9ACTN|nr:NUDIX hydrolase [Jatrophihabitans telluris]UQX87024.1 NUDIX hydrolase [Jatrophihabitans telluris]